MPIEPSPPPAPKSPRRRARDAVLSIAVVALLLVLFQGPSVRHAGEQMRLGWQRTVVLAVGRPAGWVADLFPFAALTTKLERSVKSPPLSGPGGFAQERFATAAGVAQVTRDAFAPGSLGQPPPAPRALHTVLVTGDSMSMPLDQELAQRLTATPGVRTDRDPHVGSGISQSDIVDWGLLSHAQVRRDHPDAVVMFIGANEGWPMQVGGRSVRCCGIGWVTEYASRVRRMMATYRQGGRARVYWLLLPQPRAHDRQVIARVVNAAIRVAAEPYVAQVRVIDLGAIFTPHGQYRDAMTVAGRPQIVRQSDGIHLNETGAGVAADRVMQALRADFRVRTTG